MRVKFGDHSRLECIPKATEGLTPGKEYDVIEVLKGTSHTPHDMIRIRKDNGKGYGVYYKYRFEEL